MCVHRIYCSGDLLLTLSAGYIVMPEGVDKLAGKSLIQLFASEPSGCLYSTHRKATQRWRDYSYPGGGDRTAPSPGGGLSGESLVSKGFISVLRKLLFYWNFGYHWPSGSHKAIFDSKRCCASSFSAPQCRSLCFEDAMPPCGSVEPGKSHNTLN